ncbi:hypothetical protein D3C76_1241420 [compost metagenome]
MSVTGISVVGVGKFSNVPSKVPPATTIYRTGLLDRISKAAGLISAARPCGIVKAELLIKLIAAKSVDVTDTLSRISEVIRLT